VAPALALSGGAVVAFPRPPPPPPPEPARPRGPRPAPRAEEAALAAAAAPARPLAAAVTDLGWGALPGGRDLDEWAGAHGEERVLAKLCAALAGGGAEGGAGAGAAAGAGADVPLHKRKGTARAHLLDAVRELRGMGFGVPQALGALLAAEGDVVRAINELAGAS